MINGYLTWFTYSQEEISSLNEVNFSGIKSWVAQRSAEAAIVDGLYCRNFNSGIENI